MNLNSGQPWSEADLWDLRNSLAHGGSTEEVADFLCRDTNEVSAKMLGRVSFRSWKSVPLEA
jgi:hypothetical protein